MEQEKMTVKQLKSEQKEQLRLLKENPRLQLDFLKKSLTPAKKSKKPKKEN